MGQVRNRDWSGNWYTACTLTQIYLPLNMKFDEVAFVKIMLQMMHSCFFFNNLVKRTDNNYFGNEHNSIMSNL